MQSLSRAVAFVVATAPGILCAQQSVTNASLSGRVLDPADAAVPHVTVVATSKLTGATYETETDAMGRFRMPYLPIGNYEVRAAGTGFAKAARLIELTVGSAYDLTLQLKVVQTSSTVDVNDSGNSLEANRSQISETVSNQEINSLPFNGRNYLDFALLTPGCLRRIQTVRRRSQRLRQSLGKATRSTVSAISRMPS